MEDLEKAELIVDDITMKRHYLTKMYFLLGLHFTVISGSKQDVVYFKMF